MKIIICPCGHRMNVPLHLESRKKYCSKYCFYKYRKRPSGLKYKIKTVNSGWFRKGIRVWNKGMKGEYKLLSVSIKLKGKHNSSETEFKRGENIGSNNVNWKGDNVGYGALHGWVVRCLGVPNICEECGSKENICWANISRKYQRKLNDWRKLCCVCHRKFDGLTKLEKEDAIQIRKRYGQGERQSSLAREYNVHKATISNIINRKVKYYA